MAEEEGQSAAPLLEEIKKRTAGGRRTYAVEGCPGCAVDRRKAANPGIPYGSFIYVWIVTLCTGTHISLSIAPRSYRMNKIACLLANNNLQIKLLACCCCLLAPSILLGVCSSFIHSNLRINHAPYVWIIIN
jgi:hypothetical protein